MHSLTIQKVKLKKANEISRYRRNQQIKTMFKFIEISLFLIMISRLISQFPIDFNLSIEYFRGVFVPLVSPRLVFIIGNGIIIILYFKSGQFSAQDDTNNNRKLELYDQSVENNQKHSGIYVNESKKQNSSKDNMFSSKERKIYRSKSENVLEVNNEENCRELRRSEMGRGQKSVDFSEKWPVYSYVKDELSGEEFRRTVEAFIARQQRSLREE